MKTFSISVDCEDLREGPGTGYNLYDCKVSNAAPGIPKLIEIFDQLDVAATFFVDVYNVQKRISTEALKNLCRQIVLNGHEVGLHTHPPKNMPGKAHLFDSPVGYLADLSRAEQYELLRQGKEQLEDWTGSAIVTHRGGSYSINAVSFELLGQLGFKTDASIFWPALDYDFIPAGQRNMLNPFYCGGIIEVPVSCFFSTFLMGKRLALFKKLDINWSTKREITRAHTRIACHVDLFLHSYSLFDMGKAALNGYFARALQETIEELKRDRGNLRLEQVQPAAERQPVPEVSALWALTSPGGLRHTVLPKLRLQKLKAHLQRSRAARKRAVSS